MKEISIALLILASCYSCQQPKKTESEVAAENKWVVLFDGSDTDAWRAFHKEHFPDSGWYIKDGELLNDGSGRGGLISRDQFSTFILEWEWRLFDEGGNSGLKYFVKEESDKQVKYAYGLEYQMLDDERHAWMIEGKMKPNDYHTSGALYEFFAPSPGKKLQPLGQFNKSKIVVDGDHVEHWLNGVKVVEYERGGSKFMEMKAHSKFKDLPQYGLHQEGHILLQDHQSRVGFKNIRIKKI